LTFPGTTSSYVDFGNIGDLSVSWSFQVAVKPAPSASGNYTILSCNFFFIVHSYPPIFAPSPPSLTHYFFLNFSATLGDNLMDSIIFYWIYCLFFLSFSILSRISYSFLFFMAA
jgi:hypothetical protein